MSSSITTTPSSPSPNPSSITHNNHAFFDDTTPSALGFWSNVSPTPGGPLSSSHHSSGGSSNGIGALNSNQSSPQVFSIPPLNSSGTITTSALPFTSPTPGGLFDVPSNNTPSADEAHASSTSLSSSSSSPSALKHEHHGSSSLLGHSGVTPTPLSIGAFTSIYDAPNPPQPPPQPVQSKPSSSSHHHPTSLNPNNNNNSNSNHHGSNSGVNSHPLTASRPITVAGLSAFTNNPPSQPPSSGATTAHNQAPSTEESPSLGIFTPSILNQVNLDATPQHGDLADNSAQLHHQQQAAQHHMQMMHAQQQGMMAAHHNPLSAFNFGNKIPSAHMMPQQIPSANLTFNVNNAATYIPIPMNYGMASYVDPNGVANSSSPSPSSPVGESLPSGVLMSVVRGFNVDDGVPEEHGGKDNKKTLTTHVVRVRVADLMNAHPLPSGYKYMINAVLLGYKRYEKEEISSLESQEIALKSQSEEDFTFDNMVVKHTSHSNGQKLFLRFKLVMCNDRDEKVLEQLDTTYFKTVTKRAIIKRQNTKKIDEQKKKVTKLLQVEPKYSVTTGGQLIKIVTDNMPEKVRLQTLIVKFGEKKARRVHSARDNMIICETPEYQKAEGVPISISMDNGVSFFHAPNVKMTFIDPATDTLPEVTPHSKTFVVNFATAGGGKHANSSNDEDEDLDPKKKKSKK
ncbi:hypothetical protein C9374_013904 [Naegleria lovaniensis]|uniref:Uncharacterized protein n=1 Tax=Naegleria lovaniensis TaxID=51637 RepID=A0AA88H148_NAELO|nr:uncharacterized protein C9374_013904 [Naegleria lovaniensis]KAG2389344.1 hypothetical protein C9374_013904 [Naegleria lovaniensis]